MQDLAVAVGKFAARDAFGHAEAAKAKPAPVRRNWRRGIGLIDGPDIESPDRDDSPKGRTIRVYPV
jgi:hypothetical protein